MKRFTKDIGAILVQKSTQKICKIVNKVEDKYIVEFEDGTEKTYKYNTLNGKFDLYKGDNNQMTNTLESETIQETNIAVMDKHIENDKSIQKQIEDDVERVGFKNRPLESKKVQEIQQIDTENIKLEENYRQIFLEENQILKRYIVKLEEENSQLPILKNRISELENVIKNLKSSSGKGRKPKYTILDIERMKKEIISGKSYKEVGNMFGCSSTFVFNSIKKLSE